MKLFAVVVFGFIAIAGSEAAHSHHGSSHHHVGNNDNGNYQGYDQENNQGYDQGNDRHGQHNNDFGLTQNGQNQEQNSQEFMSQLNNNQDSSNKRSLYSLNQQNNHGQNDQYSESNWEVQSPRSLNNKNGRNVQNRENSQEQYGEGNQRTSMDSFNQQNSEEHQNMNYQRQMSHGSSLNFNSGSSSSEESTSHESQENIKQQNNGDIADDIGRQTALKMVKLFSIVDKYTARHGAVQTNQAQEPLPVRQWALPTERHQFLNINDSKVNGLSQGIINAMYVNTENNIVNLEYFFKSLLVKGNLKANMGQKGLFDLQMINSNVSVSTVLGNHNRNYAHSNSGNVEFSAQNFQDSSDSRSVHDNIKSKYVQFINRAIENEMIDDSYNGLIGCLRSEVESTFNMPPTPHSDMVIENKKSQLTVTLKRSHTWSDDSSSAQRKIHSVAFRQNKSGSGYKLKVKIVLAKQPTWDSDVIANDAHQQINVKNVHFSAKKIVATAVMERVALQNGEYKFNVENANINMEGFKYDIGKFNQVSDINQKLSLEIGQNLQKIIENGMSAALKTQLYQQQQICHTNSKDCVKCNQYNKQN